MNTVIIYGSNYGSSKKYAEKLASITKIPCFDYQSVPEDCATAQHLVYIGSLYAGGIVGLAKTVQKLHLKTTTKQLTLVTVGLSDPTNSENTDSIKKGIDEFSTKNAVEAKKIFHLRGSISYEKLTFKHRLLMKMMYESTKKKNSSELTNENNEFLATYGKEVDFIEFSTLEPLISYLNTANN